MHDDVSPNKIILAVAKAIEAKFDRGDWIELGILADTRHIIENHGRLLRSLHWNDDDYGANIFDVVPDILGELTRGRRTAFTNLAIVEDFLGLRGWLREHEPTLHAELYGGQETHETATDDLQAAARTLGLHDIDEHAARIPLGMRNDPPLAIGASKELLETVFKAILGLQGSGTKPSWTSQTWPNGSTSPLGLDDQGARRDEPGAKHLRGVLKGLNSIVNGIGEIRNEGFGTGHGVYGRPKLDVATARLMVTAAAAAATFYIEAHAVINDSDD